MSAVRALVLHTEGDLSRWSCECGEQASRALRDPAAVEERGRAHAQVCADDWDVRVDWTKR